MYCSRWHAEFLHLYPYLVLRLSIRSVRVWSANLQAKSLTFTIRGYVLLLVQMVGCKTSLEDLSGLGRYWAPYCCCHLQVLKQLDPLADIQPTRFRLDLEPVQQRACIDVPRWALLSFHLGTVLWVMDSSLSPSDDWNPERSHPAFDLMAFLLMVQMLFVE
jgi:hypothetical protein